MQHGVTVDILCIVKLQEYRGELQEYRGEFFNEIRMKTSKWEKKNSSGKSKTCLLFIKTFTIVPISSDTIL